MKKLKTKLLISKKSFKTKLSHFIDEVRSLENFNQISENHFKTAKKSFRLWEKRVETYLSQTFSSDSISKEFSDSSGTFLMRSASFQARCEELVDDIDEKVTRLKMIIESEDIKEELHSSKFKISTRNKVQWKHLINANTIKIIVAVISAISIILVALINRSNTKQNEVKVILNNYPGPSPVGEVN